MDNLILYLHPDATLSASWLPDKHVMKALKEAEGLLSSASQMIICDRDERLPDFADHQLLPWTLESMYHFDWVLSYYRALIRVQATVFNKEYRSWKLDLVFCSYLRLFPRLPFSPPPVCVPDDCKAATADESYRNYLLRCRIGVGSYRRVRVPHFVKDYFDAH